MSASPMPDPNLAAFLKEVNQQIAVVYDEEGLALLQNELHGRNDVVALQLAEIANEKLLRYVKSQSTRVAKFKRLQLGDALQRRQLERVPLLGYDALGDVEANQLYALAANMSDSYQRVKLCGFRQPNDCTLRLIPEVQRLVQESRNLAEIEYYWLEWRRITGLATRQQFVSFMELYKKTAKLNGFVHAEDYWFRNLELTGHQTMTLLNELMASLRPLFLQFHAHVRGSLRKMHGERLVARGRPYPQHLAEVFLGNAFGRARADRFVDLPSPEAGLANITDALHRRGLTTTQRVFWNVAEYFRGLGLLQLEGSLWANAQPVSTQNEDHCWHKAWRFPTLSRTNFSFCPLNDEERFFNMFEAQCDLHYLRAAAVQPTLLREEPFPNFGDALGKCFSLAASSPRYLRKLGLLQGTQWLSVPSRLNRLYLQGLRIIFLIPVFYVLDRYREEVLRGHIKADDNEAFWRLTEMYTGATAPQRRNNDQFDVPSLLHAMSLGSSLHYKEVLQQLLGTGELSMDGLLTYFKPLQDWLTLQNRQNGAEVGWQ